MLAVRYLRQRSRDNDGDHNNIPVQSNARCGAMRQDASVGMLHARYLLYMTVSQGIWATVLLGCSVQQVGGSVSSIAATHQCKQPLIEGVSKESRDLFHVVVLKQLL